MTAQQLKNSILQMAVQGKLVPQDPNDESASVLLERIKAEKQALIKAGKIKKEKPITPITKDVIPFDIPNRWEWVKLGEITTVLGGKRIPAGRKLSIENTGHIYIRVSDMKEDSVSTANLQFVPDDIFESISRYIINKEDVYITVAGTIGRIGKIPPEIDGANLTENADRLVFKIINQDWLIRCLQSSVVQSQIADATTKVGQPKLAIARIQNLLIPLPPIEEQKRIVAKIEELLPYIEKYEKTETKLTELNTKFPEALKKSILQEAVQGKLVSQNPDDEPASVLLERIKAEKQKLIKEGKIKKEKPLAPITEEEIPFDIPESWEWCRLIDIVKEKPSNGLSPKGVDYVTDVRNLTLTATTSGRFKADAFKYVNISLEEAKKYWLKNGDILIQRSNSRELVGTSCIYDGIDQAYIYPDLMMRIHLLDGICTEYIDYVLKSPFVRKYYSQSASGTSSSMPKINQQIVSMTLIPLPPHNEQKRVVARIEELTKYCDKL